MSCQCCHAVPAEENDVVPSEDTFHEEVGGLQTKFNELEARLESIEKNFEGKSWSKEEQNHKITKLDNFLDEYKVSGGLGNRVKFEVKSAMESKRTLTDDVIPELLCLPVSMRRELYVEICWPIIGTHPLFRHLANLDEDFKGRLCGDCIKMCSLKPGDCLFEKGSTANEMYFIRTGKLQCTDGEKCVNYVPGQWINEEALFVQRRPPFGASHEGEEASTLVAISADAFVCLIDRSDKLLDFIKCFQPLYSNNLQSEEQVYPGKGVKDGKVQELIQAASVASVPVKD